MVEEIEVQNDLIIDVNDQHRKVFMASDFLPDDGVYRHLHFRNSKECVLYIDVKLVRCTLYECENFDVHVQTDVICCIEYIKTHHSNLFYERSHTLPYIQCDMSSNITFFSMEPNPIQRQYVCTQCMNLESEWNGKRVNLPYQMTDNRQILFNVDHSSPQIVSSSPVGNVFNLLENKMLFIK